MGSAEWTMEGLRAGLIIFLFCLSLRMVGNRRKGSPILMAGHRVVCWRASNGGRNLAIHTRPPPRSFIFYSGRSSRNEQWHAPFCIAVVPLLTVIKKSQCRAPILGRDPTPRRTPSRICALALCYYSCHSHQAPLAQPGSNNARIEMPTAAAQNPLYYRMFFFIPSLQYLEYKEVLLKTRSLSFESRSSLYVPDPATR